MDRKQYVLHIEHTSLTTNNRDCALFLQAIYTVILEIDASTQQYHVVLLFNADFPNDVEQGMNSVTLPLG